MPKKTTYHEADFEMALSGLFMGCGWAPTDVDKPALCGYGELDAMVRGVFAPEMQMR